MPHTIPENLTPKQKITIALHNVIPHMFVSAPDLQIACAVVELPRPKHAQEIMRRSLVELLGQHTVEMLTSTDEGFWLKAEHVALIQSNAAHYGVHDDVLDKMLGTEPKAQGPRFRTTAPARTGGTGGRG